jgi:hypothetical protein
MLFGGGVLKQPFRTNSTLARNHARLFVFVLYLCPSDEMVKIDWDFSLIHKLSNRYTLSFFILFCFFMLAVVGFFSTVGVLIYRTFHAIQSKPDGAGFQASVQKMEAELSASQGNLVPWATDTMSLLCANPIEQHKKGLFLQTSHSGVMGTIYQEPVANYTKTELGKSYLLMVKTLADTYLYRKTTAQTEIWVNQELIGVLVGDSILSGDNKGRLLAQLDADTQQPERLLTIGDTPTLTLCTKHAPDEVNPRAVQVLSEPKDPKLAQALVFYFVVG